MPANLSYHNIIAVTKKNTWQLQGRKSQVFDVHLCSFLKGYLLAIYYNFTNNQSLENMDIEVQS